MKTLSFKDIITLGFLNLALFVGAGNIIFPPFIGYMAGTNVIPAAIGFLLTGVGLPILTAIAMGPVEGSMTRIMSPMGRVLSILVIVSCYLFAGPLGAIPRAATVAYDLAVLPFIGDNVPWGGSIYYPLFFLLTILAASYPQKLFNIVGQFLTPVKIIALALLCATVFVLPVIVSAPKGAYINEPFSQGIVQGYLTMDTFASLIFGVILVNAVRSRGVTDIGLTTRYIVYSAIIAGIGLICLYLCLFRLGRVNVEVASAINATNGAQVLSSYIAYHFGIMGKILVAFLITIACLVASIGVLSSASLYFNELTGISYRFYIWTFGIIATLISNLGLTKLIDMSVPILQAIYPVLIIVIVTSFFYKRMKNPSLIVVPASLLGFYFGLADAFKTQAIDLKVFSFAQHFPLVEHGLGWLVPCALLIAICAIFDALFSKKKISNAI